MATSFTSGSQILQSCRRRMWADGIHRDLKSQGHRLDKTHIRDWRALSRFFLALALLYVWSVATGTQVIKRRKHHLVDRRYRRDLSVFRIGYDMLIRTLSHGDLAKLRFLRFIYPSRTIKLYLY